MRWSQFRLPLIILTSFLSAAAWVLFGRLLFGVFGWMVFILLFTIVPIIVIYGLALTLIVAIRQRTYTYKPNGRFVVSLYATLASLFVLGLTVPDGGDTGESAGSALTILMGDMSNGDFIAISGFIAGWSIFAAFVASVAALVFAFVERSRSSRPDAPPSNLKVKG